MFRNPFDSCHQLIVVSILTVWLAKEVLVVIAVEAIVVAEAEAEEVAKVVLYSIHHPFHPNLTKRY